MATISERTVFGFKKTIVDGVVYASIYVGFQTDETDHAEAWAVIRSPVCLATLMSAMHSTLGQSIQSISGFQFGKKSNPES
ncbi:MAG: hypothetical protein LRY66_08455 [Saccharospirillaceae bacterium]|nr:hypothetical protein [Saccharospirillaceae bacterium]MCD8531380.1 hypothetical protein [Saccharospirillaceae bacterium]